jgi:tellurite resistance protein TerA
VPIDYTKRPASQPGPAVPPPPPPPPSPSPSGATPGAAGAAPVSLSKVRLTKSSPSVSLTKQGSATGIMRVNLNWSRQAAAPVKTGLFGRASAGSGAVDLDLACLYEYADGTKGVIQALGNAFRDRHSYGADPICWLDGDDRSGAVSGGENLFVDLRHVAAIRRILVYAFIYEGVPNWAAADAVVTLHPASGAEVEIRLDEHDPRSPVCAIAMLENVGGDLQVNREVRYIQGSQRELDQAYGWGMRWGVGRK